MSDSQNPEKIPSPDPDAEILNELGQRLEFAAQDEDMLDSWDQSSRKALGKSAPEAMRAKIGVDSVEGKIEPIDFEKGLPENQNALETHFATAALAIADLLDESGSPEEILDQLKSDPTVFSEVFPNGVLAFNGIQKASEKWEKVREMWSPFVDVVGCTFLAVKAEAQTKTPFSSQVPPEFFAPAIMAAAPGESSSEKKTWLQEIGSGVSAVGRDLVTFVRENSRTIAIGAAVAAGLYFLKSLFFGGEQSEKESDGFFGFFKKILGVGAIGVAGTMGFKMIEQFLKGDFEGIFSEFAKNAREYGFEKAKEMLTEVLGEERAERFFEWFEKSGKVADLLENPSGFLGKEWESKKADIEKFCSENNIPTDWLPDFPKIYQEYVREKGISTGATIALGTVLSWWAIKKGPMFFVRNVFRVGRFLPILVLAGLLSFFVVDAEARDSFVSQITSFGKPDGEGKIGFGEAIGGAIETSQELTKKITEKWEKVVSILREQKLLSESSLGFSDITPDFLETRLAEFRKNHPTLNALGVDELAEVALLILVVAVSGQLLRHLSLKKLFSKLGLAAAGVGLLLHRKEEGVWLWNDPLVAPAFGAISQISKECLPNLPDNLELPTGIFDEVEPLGIYDFATLRETLVGLGLAVPNLAFSREELGQLRVPLTELSEKFTTAESKGKASALLAKIAELEKKEEGAMLFSGYFAELVVLAREQGFPFSVSFAENGKFSLLIEGVDFPPIFDKNPIPFLRTPEEARESIAQKVKKNFKNMQQFFAPEGLGNAPENLEKMCVTRAQTAEAFSFLQEFSEPDFSELTLADWEEFSQKMSYFGISEWDNDEQTFCFSLKGDLGKFHLGIRPGLSDEEIVFVEPYFDTDDGFDILTGISENFESAHSKAAQELREDFPADEYPKTAELLLKYERDPDAAFDIPFLLELIAAIGGESSESIWQITANEGLTLFAFGKQYVFGAAGSFSAAIVDGLFEGDAGETMEHLAKGEALLLGGAAALALPGAAVGAAAGGLSRTGIQKGAWKGATMGFRFALKPLKLLNPMNAFRTIHVGRNFSEWLAIQGQKAGTLPDRIKSNPWFFRRMRAESIEKLYVLANREQDLWKRASVGGQSRVRRILNLKEHLAREYTVALSSGADNDDLARERLTHLAQEERRTRTRPRFRPHLRRGAALLGLVGGAFALSAFAGDDLETEGTPSTDPFPKPQTETPRENIPVEGDALSGKKNSLEHRFSEVIARFPQVPESESFSQKALLHFSEEKKKYIAGVHEFVDEYKAFLDWSQKTYGSKSPEFFANITAESPFSLFSADIKGDQQREILVSLRRDSDGVFLESVDSQKLLTYLLESPEADEELMTILFRLLPVTGDALDFHDAYEHGKKGNTTEMLKSIGWGIFGTALTLSSFVTFGGGAVANVIARLGRVSARILSLLPKASPAIRAFFVRAFEKLPAGVRENETVAKVLSAAKSGVGGNILQLGATVLVDGIRALPKNRSLISA